MTIWVDAQLSPAIAGWMTGHFGIAANSVRDLGLRDADDVAIFAAARTANAIVLTKDVDFVELVKTRGTPPAILWLRCGNTSNARLRVILQSTLPGALQLIQQGAAFVEVIDFQTPESPATFP